MILSDFINETYSAITANKARTGLTILGIVIGIASVISMLAIGKGAQNSIEKSIQSIGSNLLMVRPGASRSFGQVSGGQGSAATLVKKDADQIKKESELVQYVAPEVSKSYQVIATGTNTKTTITGTTSEYLQVKNLEIDEGSFLSDQHEKKMSKVAVLGPDAAIGLFEEDTGPVGQKIRINGIDFSIIGTTVAKGGSGLGSADDIIYVPLSTAQQFLSGSDTLSMINITVIEEELMDEAQKEITTILLNAHNLNDSSEADFNIRNQADIIETASSVTGIFTMLLGAVAGISLVVGGIGIMNMMLTSVTERTREIGLRKAIGAKSADISTQFLIESVVLTFIGGIFGVILGWGISFAISSFASLDTEVSSFSVILAFSVSAAIGIIFGYYPARRASKLNPIDALRYE